MHLPLASVSRVHNGSIPFYARLNYQVEYTCFRIRYTKSLLDVYTLQLTNSYQNCGLTFCGFCFFLFFKRQQLCGSDCSGGNGRQQAAC